MTMLQVYKLSIATSRVYNVTLCGKVPHNLHYFSQYSPRLGTGRRLSSWLNSGLLQAVGIDLQSRCHSSVAQRQKQLTSQIPKPMPTTPPMPVKALAASDPAVTPVNRVIPLTEMRGIPPAAVFIAMPLTSGQRSDTINSLKSHCLGHLPPSPIK